MELSSALLLSVLSSSSSSVAPELALDTLRGSASESASEGRLSRECGDPVSMALDYMSFIGVSVQGKKKETSEESLHLQEGNDFETRAGQSTVA